jgi:hypothetical protein
MATDFDWAGSAVQLATSGVGTVVGAFLGYRLALSAHVREKRHDFIVEQLRDFYAPMLSLRDEISTTTNQCWDLRHNFFDPDYFYKNVCPLYRKLASIFSEKLWLASPATRRFHPLVMKTVGAFQELIDNDLVDYDHIDPEQRQHFEVLIPFYDHLDQTLDALQRKLLPDD